MICPQCGQYNEDNARFCGNCGTDLSAVAAQAAQQQAPAAPEQPAYTPDFVSQPAQPTYQQGSFPQTQQPSQPAASYDTGSMPAQPQGYDYAQQPQPGYDPAPQQYAQQPYQQAPAADPYAQQAYQQPAADPYAQQGYQQAPAADPYAQQQYAQGYNAPVEQPKKKFPVLPVVVGVVAVVAVVGAFLLFRGNSGGGTGGGTPTITASEWELTSTYTNTDGNFSFNTPAGRTIDNDDGDGNVWMYFSEGYLNIHTYIGDASPADSGSELAQSIIYGNSDFNMSSVETGSDYAILVGTDPDDGDTNYTLCIMRENDTVWMDVYYKPADESTMRDVTLAIMHTMSV